MLMGRLFLIVLSGFYSLAAFPLTITVGSPASITPTQLEVIDASFTKLTLSPVVLLGGSMLDWSGFDIGANVSVNFIQPSSNSITLNRVVPANRVVFGSLTGNKQVILQNPPGLFSGGGITLLAGSTTDTITNLILPVTGVSLPGHAGVTANHSPQITLSNATVPLPASVWLFLSAITFVATCVRHRTAN